MVLGSMQRVKMPDKVKTYIMLFHSDCGYYPHFLDISAFRGYYLYFVDIICVGHITNYLVPNFHTMFQIYSSSLSD